MTIPKEWLVEVENLHFAYGERRVLNGLSLKIPVTRIDLRYRYPEGLGLEPRVEEDGGDIYGPSGTTVDLTIVTDKPVTTGALTMGDGTRVPLAGEAARLSAPRFPFAPTARTEWPSPTSTGWRTRVTPSTSSGC